MSERTPGPWVVYKPQVYPYIRSAAPSHLGHYVVDHSGPTAGHVRRDADARLIAQAPEYLAEATEFVKWVRSNPKMSPELSDLRYWADRFAAINAKAEARP